MKLYSSVNRIESIRDYHLSSQERFPHHLHFVDIAYSVELKKHDIINITSKSKVVCRLDYVAYSVNLKAHQEEKKNRARTVMFQN